MQEPVDEGRFRQCPLKLNRLVDHHFGHAKDLIFIDQVRKFTGIDHFTGNKFILKGQLMGSPDSLKAVRAGEGNQNLDAGRLFPVLQPFFTFC